MISIQKNNLSFIEEKILKSFIESINKEIKEALKIIIFGSRIKGRSDENSDLDVAVVLNLLHINKEIRERLWDIKWKVLEKLKSEEFPLSLTLIKENDLKSRNFGLFKILKTEGLIIWKRMN